MLPGQNPVRGVLWMAGAVLSFATMAVAVRELLRDMGILEILFWRTFVALLIAAGFALRQGAAAIRTRRLPIHAVRALVHLGGQFCWMYAIAALALATVFAIEFTMPVWTALLAFLFLGERLTPNRIVMLLLGVVGITIILRPGVGPFHPAGLVMLFGALLYAGNIIFTKSLSKTDTAIAVTFWMSVVQAPVTLVAAWPGWVMPQALDLPWIAAIGAGPFAAH
jgi:drug/metabolite transporter (DMT)-like permease